MSKIIRKPAQKPAAKESAPKAQHLPTLERLSDAEGMAERFLHELAGKTPTEAAQELFMMQRQIQGAASQSFRAICLFITHFDQKKQAEDFVEGWRDAADKLANVGTEGERKSAKSIGEYASRLARVVRSVWGVRGNKDFVPLGADKTRTELLKKGEIGERINALPSTRSAGSSGSTKGEEPIQITRAASLTQQPPSMDNLASALGATKSDKLTEKQFVRLVETKLEAAIKSCPDGDLGQMLGHVVSRLLTAKDESMRDLGVSIRDALKMIQTKPQRQAAKTK